ncbi:MAG: helicase, partial [Thermoguttaceae bacterium]
MFTPAEILGPSGRIAARLKNYESRPEQLAMAEAVDRAIRAKHHLVVEAGTGVGKSFAYLVPAIMAAAGTQGTVASDDASDNKSLQDSHNPPHPNPLPKGEGTENKNLPKGEGMEVQEPHSLRVVVATHTISLQEQLMEKDLPFLNSVIPLEFSAVLVKGRSNYISLRRLKNAMERMASLFDDDEELEQLRALNKWSKETSDGSLADLDFRPMASVWDEVASDHGNCMGRQCPTYASCFYYQARRRMQHAQILVVNHALFFSDLALRMQNAGILPPYDVVIFDEAHNIEAVAGDHLGLSVTNGQVDYILRKLYNDRTNKGLLVYQRFAEAQQAVMECRHRADQFFQSIDDWLADHPKGNGRVREPKIVGNPLSEGLEKLAGLLHRKSKELKKPEEKQD